MQGPKVAPSRGKQPVWAGGRARGRRGRSRALGRGSRGGGGGGGGGTTYTGSHCFGLGEKRWASPVTPGLGLRIARRSKVSAQCRCRRQRRRRARRGSARCELPSTFSLTRMLAVGSCAVVSTPALEIGGQHEVPSSSGVTRRGPRGLWPFGAVSSALGARHSKLGTRSSALGVRRVRGGLSLT